jgi:hypothetical protein
LYAIRRILPASTQRNRTSLQPVKINAIRKSRALIGCCHKENATRCSRDRPSFHTPLVITMVTHALCLDAFWLVTCQVASKIWIQLHWEWLACRNNHRLKGYPFAKIVPKKLAKKQCLLIFLLEIWDCKSFVQYYLIHTEILSVINEILSVINSQESGFARMLQSDAVIWFQRYQRSDLKRGSISLRQIESEADWSIRVATNAILRAGSELHSKNDCYMCSEWLLFKVFILKSLKVLVSHFKCQPCTLLEVRNLASSDKKLTPQRGVTPTSHGSLKVLMRHFSFWSALFHQLKDVAVPLRGLPRKVCGMTGISFAPPRIF